VTHHQRGRILIVVSAGVHGRNFHSLIRHECSDILVITDGPIDYCRHARISFGMRNPLRLWREIRKLQAIIADYRPDIIHVHQANNYGYVATVANRKRFPLVLTTWGSDVLVLPRQGVIHRAVACRSLREADFVTADACFMADAIHGLVGRSDVVIANFGVDIAAAEEARPRERVIYSNRLHHGLYNIDRIITGAARFLKPRRDWSLTIAGSGPKTELLQSQAAAQIPPNQYRFIGFVPAEVNRLHSLASHIYVSIPTSDGTSMSLLEAMACGAIPVVSDIPANREWVRDGENGIVLRDGNLEEALERSLELDRSDVAARNAAIIAERGSREANRRIFLSIYDRCR
jgi:glycosyltransferase involved in cell wall biosynthesis